MSRILLVNPWIYDFTAYDLWQKPLGLLYIGSVLRKAGHAISLFDCLDRFHPALPNFSVSSPLKDDRNFGDGKYIKTEVAKPQVCCGVKRRYSRYGMPADTAREFLNAIEKPDFALVTSGMTYWYLGVQYTIGLIRESYPNIPVILGGIYATLCRNHAERYSGADLVISGESEYKINDVLNEWIPPVNQICPDLPEIDRYPYPCLDLYPRLKSIPVLTSRGCPFHCTFCASHLLHGNFRQRNPEGVVEELLYWWDRVHVPDAAFFDDALLINSERHFLPIMEGVVRSKIPLRFHTPNGLSPAFIGKDEAFWMKKGGFTTIRLSLDTISSGLQEDIQGKVSAEKFADAVDRLEAAGYNRNQIGAYILMGLPGQSAEDVLDAVFFVARMGAKVKLAQFSPIPGTEAWAKEVEHRNISEDMDLLLTNDTLLPLRSKVFTWDVVRMIKELAVTLNRQVDKGLKEVEFMLTHESNTWKESILNAANASSF